MANNPYRFELVSVKRNVIGYKSHVNYSEMANFFTMTPSNTNMATITERAVDVPVIKHTSADDFFGIVYRMMNGVLNSLLVEDDINSIIATTFSGYLDLNRTTLAVYEYDQQDLKDTPSNDQFAAVVTAAMHQAYLKAIVSLCNMGVVTEGYISRRNEHFTKLFPGFMITRAQIMTLYDKFFQYVKETDMAFVMHTLIARVESLADIAEIVDEATGKGMSGLRLISKAYEQFPDFPWGIIKKYFPGDWRAMMKASEAYHKDPLIGFKDAYRSHSEVYYPNLGYLSKIMFLNGSHAETIVNFQGFPESRIRNAKKLNMLATDYLRDTEIPNLNDSQHLKGSEDTDPDIIRFLDNVKGIQSYGLDSLSGILQEALKSEEDVARLNKARMMANLPLYQPKAGGPSGVVKKQ